MKKQFKLTKSQIALLDEKTKRSITTLRTAWWNKIGLNFNQEELNQTSKILWLKAITSPLSHVFFLILISFFNFSFNLFFFSLK